MKGKDYKVNFKIVLIGIAIVSIIANVYQYGKIYNYKKALKKDSYNNIEAIRYTNESILTILEACTEAKVINREELTMLYTTYNTLVEYDNELWKEYIKDEDNLFGSKLRSKEEINNTQLFWNIEKLLYNYLISSGEEIILDDEILKDFSAMKLLSNEINDLYKEFYEKNNLNIDSEEKEKEMINKDYWIEIFEGIQEVTSKYIGYPFIYEEEKI